MWDFWTSVGTKLRASLSMTVTISIPVLPIATAPQTVGVQTGIQMQGSPSTRIAEAFVGGTVTNATNAVVAGATVTAIELGLAAISDANGQFSIGPVASGNYTLRAVVGTTTATKAVAVPLAAGANYNLQVT